MRSSDRTYAEVEKSSGSGYCDRSGFLFDRKDLVKQMEWRGESLRWTGMLVAKQYLDIPNEQSRTIRLPADPYPIKDPRAAFSQTQTFANNTLGNLSTCTYRLNQVSDTENGVLKTQAQIISELQSANFMEPG